MTPEQQEVEKALCHSDRVASFGPDGQTMKTLAAEVRRLRDEIKVLVRENAEYRAQLKNSKREWEIP